MAAVTTDPTERFFARLAAREHELLLRKASGSIRFEIVDGTRVRRWVVAVSKGDLRVAAGGGAAECVVRADRKVFERLASGRMNAVAAVLRGDLSVDGDWRLLVLTQRLFPGPRRTSPK
ncbi:MAG TPA: SCP2 sterol-binding domain-containing protein [Gaiellaceae bacterium]|nr:SCP2 sterol-binding domain-containing protein [Gaiellaceae bacterium]